jgi:hypothetical protein
LLQTIVIPAADIIPVNVNNPLDSCFTKRGDDSINKFHVVKNRNISTINDILIN